MRCGRSLSVALSILLVGAACGGESVEPVAPTSGPLVPGPAIDGLRLSARLDVERGLVRYEVENVGNQPRTYVHRFLDAVLEVRRDGAATWLPLHRRPGAFRPVSGMGPRDRDVRTLEPGAALPRDAYATYVDQRRFTPNEGTPLPGLEVPSAPEPFTLDLLDFLWPPALGDLDRGVIELRVVQVHPDWAELLTEPPWSGRVPSAVLRLVLERVPAVVRAQLDRSSP